MPPANKVERSQLNAVARRGDDAVGPHGRGYLGGGAAAPRPALPRGSPHPPLLMSSAIRLRLLVYGRCRATRHSRVCTAGSVPFGLRAPGCAAALSTPPHCGASHSVPATVPSVGRAETMGDRQTLLRPRWWMVAMATVVAVAIAAVASAAPTAAMPAYRPVPSTSGRDGYAGGEYAEGRRGGGQGYVYKVYPGATRHGDCESPSVTLPTAPPSSSSAPPSVAPSASPSAAPSAAPSTPTSATPSATPASSSSGYPSSTSPPPLVNGTFVLFDPTRVPPAGTTGGTCRLVSPACDDGLTCELITAGGADYAICTAVVPAGGACGLVGSRCGPGTFCVEADDPTTPCVPSSKLCSPSDIASCVIYDVACAGGTAAGVCRSSDVGDPCEVGTTTGEAACGAGLACVAPGPPDTDGTPDGLLALESDDRPSASCMAVKVAGASCVSGGLNGCAAGSATKMSSTPTLLCVSGVCVPADGSAAAASAIGDECIQGGRFEEVACGDGTPCTSTQLFRSMCLDIQTAVGAACNVLGGRPCGFGRNNMQLVCVGGACVTPPPIPAGGRCIGNRNNCADDGFTCVSQTTDDGGDVSVFPKPQSLTGDTPFVCGRQVRLGEACGAAADGAVCATPFELCVAGVCTSLSPGNLTIGEACGPDIGLCIERGDGAGTRCVNGVCAARAPLGAACTRNDDCAGDGLPDMVFQTYCGGDPRTGTRLCRGQSLAGGACGTDTLGCGLVGDLTCNAETRTCVARARGGGSGL